MLRWDDVVTICGGDDHWDICGDDRWDICGDDDCFALEQYKSVDVVGFGLALITYLDLDRGHWFLDDWDDLAILALAIGGYRQGSTGSISWLLRDVHFIDEYLQLGETPWRWQIITFET